MENKSSYTINIGKHSVTFEVGDLVWINGKKEVIKNFDKENEKAEINGFFFPIRKLRFVNNTPKNTINNALLCVYNNEYILRHSKEELLRKNKIYKALVKKEEQLKKSGLCDQAVTTQLVYEFPEMYS